MKTRTALHLFMLVIFVFGQLPLPAHAQSSSSAEISAPADTSLETTSTPAASETPVETPIDATPTETVTASPTATETPELAPTETETATPTTSETPEVVPTETVTASPTASETPVGIPTETVTASPTSEKTATPTATATTVPGSTDTPAPTPTEQAEPILLKAYPEFVSPGSRAALQWSLALPRVGLQKYDLVFTLGNGVSAKLAGQATYTSGMLRLPAAKAGLLELSIAANADAPYEIQAALQKGDTKIAETSLTLLEKTDVPALGGKARGLRGRVQVEFFARALKQDAQVFISRPLKGSRPSYSLSGNPFEIKAYPAGSQRAPGDELKSFDDQVSIEVTYDRERYAGKESRLVVYWYDQVNETWQPLPGVVDRKNGVIRAYTTHFTVFDVGLSDWQASKLPSIEAFQTSGFTGAASYSLPIQVPSGPGGLKPDITLNYNSQVVDQSNSGSQAEWVGMGWSLDVGSIQRNVKGTDDWTGDDTFSLNVGGVSSQLVYESGKGYRTADENFWYISKNAAANSWTVKDKAGNTYTFTKTLDYYYHDDTCEGENDLSFIPYVWSLTSLKNKFGQEITYTYDTTETVKYTYYSWHSNRNNCSIAVDMQVPSAAYLTNISYANGNYQIQFVREARSDFRSAWISDGQYHSFERQRLKTIIVEKKSSDPGQYDIIRKYELGYTANKIWPGFTPNPIALTSVIEYGQGGLSHLPATTFSYDDGMHLTKATNGYGGAVVFTYTPWSFEGRDSLIGDFSDSSCTLWTGRCEDHTLYVKGSTVHADIPDVLRPGGIYRLWLKHVTQPNGVTTKLGLQVNNLTPPTQVFHSIFTSTLIVTDDISMPLNGTVLRPMIVESPATQEVAVESFTIKLLYTFYRVTQKEVSDGQGHSYPYTYVYTTPKMNSCTTTVTPTEPCHDYNPEFSEFRGHASVTETGPDGRKVVTEYYQDDDLAGKVKTVTVKNAAGSILQQTLYGYAVTDLPSSTPVCKTGSTLPVCPYGTLPHAWGRLTSQEQRTYKSGGYDATQTLFYYETTYGNPTKQIEQSWNGSAWITYRQTLTTYAAATSLWLFLPIRKQVMNPGGVTQSDEYYLYDYATTTSTLPTVGKPTGTRTWVRNTDYSQVGIVYDAWGNGIKRTTYSGYGGPEAAPAGWTASITLTTFDDVYHAYPLTETNALGQVTSWEYDYGVGLPLTETDANGAVISASYDVYGRMVSLVRPGDDASNPTMKVSYYDTPLPMRIDLQQRTAGTAYVTYRKYYDGMGRLIQDQKRPALINGQSSVSVTDFSYDAYGRVILQSMPYSDTSPTPGGAIVNPATTSYDVLGRPLVVTQPDGKKVLYTYNGLTSTITDANAHQTTTQKDVWGRVTSVTPPNGPGITYTYDLLDRLKTTTRAGLTTTLTYDMAGRKTSMADPDMGQWSYDYDALGNLITQVDARSCTLSLAYDKLSRLVSKGSSGTDCGGQVSTTFSYDAGDSGKGRRTGMTEKAGFGSFWEYDERGRLIKETKTIDSNDYITQWSYNSADLPLSMTYPDDEVVNYTYNTQQLLTSVIGTDTYVNSISYDAAGRATKRILGNGVQSLFTYNAWTTQGGRLQSIKSGTAAIPAALQSLTYAYDPVGNVSSITDGVTGQAQTFSYDALDRLTSASASAVTGDAGYTEAYDYDPASGNLLHKGPSTTNWQQYFYGATHPHAVISTGSANPQKYVYDGNGNMTQRQVSADTKNLLKYDAENRLVEVDKVVSPSTDPINIAEYTYDGDDRLVKSEVNGVTTYYVSSAYQVTGSVVTKYYFAGSQRVAVRTGRVLNFLLSDQLGSTSVTLDVNGANVGELRYSAFGETRKTFGSTPTDYRYTGQREETGIGLYYYNARWYDGQLGRFTQADSIVPGGVQGLDRYAAMANNPVRYTDPSGHMVTEGCGDDGKGHCVGSVKEKAQYEYWRQRNDGLKCNRGNKAYCSYAENHPVETVVSGVGAVVGATVVEAYLLGGGAAGTAEAALWQIAKVCARSLACWKTAVALGLLDYYPPNNGFASNIETITLQRGEFITRFGENFGKYASPIGTPFSARALPPGVNETLIKGFEVLKPIENVLVGSVEGWFGQPGGGVQYYFGLGGRTIQSLINGGYLSESWP